jgi:YgiT-type zinc finger domain-containing protein
MNKINTQTGNCLDIIPCPRCEGGLLVATLEGFETSADNQTITVTDVEMDRCDQCGEIFLTPSGSERVDDARLKHQDQPNQ